MHIKLLHIGKKRKPTHHQNIYIYIYNNNNNNNNNNKWPDQFADFQIVKVYICLNSFACRCGSAAMAGR